MKTINKMKYLKSFNITESKKFSKSKSEREFEHNFLSKYKSIKPDIDDILITLSDNGIKYDVWKYADDGIGEITFDIKCTGCIQHWNDSGEIDKFLTWDMIKVEVLHLISYMNSQDIPFSKLETKQFIGGEFHKIEIYDEDEINELEDNFTFTRFNLLFSKWSDI